MAITITPTVGSTCTTGSPATIAIASLTATTAYSVAITDPNGSKFHQIFTSDVSGNVNTTWTPTTSGTLSVSIFPVTQLGSGGSQPPQSTFPSYRAPAQVLGTQVLSTAVTFNVVSGN